MSDLAATLELHRTRDFRMQDFVNTDAHGRWVWPDNHFALTTNEASSGHAPRSRNTLRVMVQQSASCDALQPDQQPGEESALRTFA